MDILKEILPQNIYEILHRSGICTPKQVMSLSLWDIKKITNLQTVDIEMIKNTVAKHYAPQSVTCDKLLGYDEGKIKSGCIVIDALLNGGFRRGVLTEIYGESGSGKTQLAMQLVANHATEGSVYICTEDLFPVKRYAQIYESISNHFSKLGENVFVEHVYEALELLSCIRVRLPKLLQQHKASIIVIDSVAAPFRCETSNYIQRAEELRELAIMLIQIAQEYNLVIVCINQVTANFENSNKILPSLGLAWSNMISYRLWLKKSESLNDFIHQNMSVRELSTVFAPDLRNKTCRFLITATGIKDF